MTTNLTTRLLTTSDLHLISDCVNQHNFMYGVPIDKTIIINRFISTFDDSNKNVIGCFEGKNCIGVCTQQLWIQVPGWILSNLFVKTTDNNILTRKYFRVWGALMEFTTTLAESKSYFDMYYVVRDNDNLYRKSWGKKELENSSVSSFTKRYEVRTIHILRSPNDIKWPYIKRLIGDIGIQALSPPHNKVLHVRRATLIDKCIPN